MKKILFVTGSRGEWGYIRPILRLIQQRDDVEATLVVTNMHLLPSYGNSYLEIERDGFHINYKIHMSLDGYNHYSQAKSLGIFLTSFPDIVETEKPDWILLAGDRGEQLIGAVVGGYTYTPVGHIQAGELSGNVDGMTRHAIGKYAHLHFAANEDAAERLRKLGEEDFRIHNVGAPQIDEMVQSPHASQKDLEEKYDLDLSKGYYLAVMHPTTEEMAKADQQIREMCTALNELPLPKIWIMPNNDAGSYVIRRGFDNYKNSSCHAFANLKREDYLGFLKGCKCIIGNSSSGLLEAPTYKIPAVNIGRRQNMRFRGINVIDVPFEKTAITNGIKKACSPDFKKMLDERCVSPYGDGRSSERILEILLTTKVDSKLLIKNLTYGPQGEN
jgi:GDP/UDP-N,N'-diacetylbacillosamine 2-epimerase (hydrolysing)